MGYHTAMRSFTMGERLAQGVGKLRRRYVAVMRPELVNEGARGLIGNCRKCGTCCRLVFICPYLMEGHCIIYEKRPRQCAEFPVLKRDLVGLEKTCGYSFLPAKGPLWHPSRICRLLGIAHYGIREVLASAVLFCLLGVLVFIWNPVLAPLPLLGFCAVLYFFRDPERRIPEGEEKILAPADGRVRDISQTVEEEFLEGPATRIGIALSILNVHVNRAPCSGDVTFIKYTPGKFHNAFGKKASSENENNLIGIGNGLAGNVAVKQIAGAVARRIVCDCRLDERVERGQRIGMIKFGSRTELFIPDSADFELMVKPGDRVKAGQTVLGILRCEK